MKRELEMREQKFPDIGWTCAKCGPHCTCGIVKPIDYDSEKIVDIIRDLEEGYDYLNHAGGCKSSQASGSIRRTINKLRKMI